jgi:glycosyltransferase involved in cell wall biosynthesis
MRITIVQGAFLPVPPVSGGAVEKIWFALGREFARRGHRVTHVSRCYPTLNREEFVDGVHHIRVPGFDIPGSIVKLKWDDLIYSRQALKILPNADVLVTNTFWLPILLRDRSRGKIYVHVARYPKGQMRFYGKAARLQAVSTVIRDAICKEAPRFASRVRLVPNFVSRSRPTSPQPKRDKCILYVGRLHPEKGIHILLEAFGRLLTMGFRDWKLRIVGPWEVKQGGGGEQFFAALRLKARGANESLEWLGPIFDPEKLSEHYRTSSVFVYPSLAATGEASPLAPLEAMAEGCPPVVSSLECFRDYIQPGGNGWIFNHRGVDPAANLASVLCSAMSDKAALSQVRENAIRTAQDYTLSKVADRYLSDFDEVSRQ